MERQGLSGVRIVAAILDAVILTVVTTIVTLTLGRIPYLGALLVLAVGLGYPVIEILRAQSPGKMIVGLKVQTEAAAPALRDQMIRRTVIKYAPSIAGAVLSFLFLLTGIGIFSLLGWLAQLGLAVALIVLSLKTLQTTKQAFWDVQAKTAVYGKALAIPAVVAAPPANPGNDQPA